MDEPRPTAIRRLAERCAQVAVSGEGYDCFQFSTYCNHLYMPVNLKEMHQVPY
jgi:hypothetical protein